MHPTTMNAPMRSVLLSSRVSPSNLALVPSSQSFHQTRRYRYRTPSSPSSSPPTSSHLGLKHRALLPAPPSITIPHRHASTSTISSPSPSAASPSPQDSSSLDWNSFFRLRTTRRRYNLVSSITTSLTTTLGGISVLSTQDIDSLGTQIFGLDPFVVFGLATAGFGALGWLVGPFLGGAVWGWVNGRAMAAFSQKEKLFYRRIRAHRVDPSTNSFQNPVPDYYGEKIGSVTDYRHWLKDQRAYNRKRKTL